MDDLLISMARRAALFAAVAGSLLLAEAGRVEAASIRADFNGDGFEDVAIGVSDEDLPDGVGGSISNAGAVNVIYGSKKGLRAKGNQFWHQNSPGILDFAEDSDNFGEDVAAGDFNGDGFDDLAVGIDDEDVGGVSGAGAVAVIYGSKKGLRKKGNQLWHQDSPGMLDFAEAGDDLGEVLAAGDFNNDGFDDLAIAADNETIDGLTDAGAVVVLYGSRRGLRARGNQFWHQGRTDILGAPGAGDLFGDKLAVGDFNGDDFEDLAIGVSGEDIAAANGAGAVAVLYGSKKKGLRARGNQLWHQDSPGILDVAEDGDDFGDALAAGDFNDDGRDDLAIGVDDEDLPDGVGGSIGDAGAVAVIHGSRRGLRARGNQFWHQDSPGIMDFAEAGDDFGESLAVGDFNGDGRDDLAIGAEDEDVGVVDNAGAVNVIYGSRRSLRARGNQFWHQDTPGVQDFAEDSDNFGDNFATGDFNNDGRIDLAIGVQDEDIGVVSEAGAVNVLYGGRKRLRAKRNQFWHQDSRGILDTAEESDSFGQSPD